MTIGKKRVLIAVVAFLILGFLYQYSPKRIEFIGHYNKVFAHRVNSLEKQKQALKYFEGIELDLEYIKEKNVLDVNHLPAKTIGLTFETYLAQIAPNNFPFLWLDIKQLDTTNSTAILLKLNTVLESRNYPKNKVLIETRFPEALPQFTKAGYKTSYYLNPKLHEKEGEVLNNEISYIKSILNKQPNIGISSSYKDYPLMKLYFPDKTKYIWAITSPYKIDFNKIKAVLEDDKVAIVLSKFKSTKGNR